jgi:hypothetical protein
LNGRRKPLVNHIIWLVGDEVEAGKIRNGAGDLNVLNRGRIQAAIEEKEQKHAA